MSDNLDVRARLVAINEMSPVVRQVIADLKKFENIAKRINGHFSNIGRAGMQSMDGFGRAAQAATAQMRGVANASRAASKSYSDGWRKATDQRLSDARKLYQQLDAIESRYQRPLDHRVTAERRAERIAGRSFGGVGNSGVSGRLPRLSTLTIGGAAFGASVASAIRKRIEVEAAETRAAMFGELSKDEIKNLRRDTDKLGLRYGVGSTAAIDAAVEGLKAGIEKQYAGEFAELGLKAKAGLDLNEADTAKLMGRLTTMHGGFDKGWLSSILNAIAVANNATAADGNEIVEAYRRSLSALTATKMKPEDLAAFDASAISIGIQPFKAGTYMSFITSELANAKNARGQRAQDLTKAAGMLGFSGRSELSERMIANPTETLLKVYGNLMKLPEGLRAKVADLIGKREWRDELMSVAAARDLIIKTLGEIANKKGFLDSTSLRKLRSMGGRWATIQAAFGLVWEKIGAGLDEIFDQVSDAIIGIAERFDFDAVRQHFAALIDGLRQGFGLKEWGEAVRSIADQFDAGSIERWREFGRGFASGIREFASGLKTAFSVMTFLTGNNPANAEATGNLVAKLTALTVALAFINPLLSVMGLVATSLFLLGSALRFLQSIGVFKLLSKMPGWGTAKVAAGETTKKVLGGVGLGGAGWLGMLLYGDGRPDNTLDDMKALQEEYRKAREAKKKRKQSSEADPLFQPSSFRNSVDDLNDQFKKFGGTVQRAAFISSPIAGFPRLGTDSGSGGVIAAVPSSLTPGGGGAYDLFNSTPGGTLPSFGVGRSGSIINNGSSGGSLGSIAVPQGGVGDTSVGQGLAGNAFLAARRARFKQELDSNPELKKRLAAVIDLENPGAGTAVAESLMNRMDMNGGSIAGGLGFNNRSRSFYGPVRKGLDISRLGELERNPAKMAARMRQIDEALAGSNFIKGHTDQGSAGDPNYMAGGVGVNINRERFNDWGGGRWGRLRGHAASAAYREWLMKGATGATSSVTPPADAVRNIPPLTVSPAGAGDIRIPSNVSIHINGGNHDPEALATLIQRRIDESMNWRTHDSESEYT